TSCKHPPRNTANKNTSKLPSVCCAVNTITTSPAAGPDTPIDEPLRYPTTIPPMIPAIIPEKTRSGLPVDAKPIPKHNGNATRKTTTLADASCLKFLKIFLLIQLRMVKLNSLHYP